MWLLKAAAGELMEDSPEETPSDDEEAERREKLEARRAADDRERLRATSKADAAGGVYGNTSNEDLRPDASSGVAQFYSLDEDPIIGDGGGTECELVDMYDFSRFLPDGVAAADAAGGGRRQVSEERRGGKEPPRDWKTSGAEKSPAATRRAEGRPEPEAPQQLPAPQLVAAPPEAPPALAAAEDDAAEEQLLELARVAEELTDALERSREAEQASRQELAEARRVLQEERSRRVGCEQVVVAARQALVGATEARQADVEEAARLRAQLAASERAVEELQQRLQRREVETGLERALASKGRSYRWHFDV